ncbi:MAG: LysR family transcriptional regulator substrate-binding protein, partial [Pseudomonadota bacterium]
RVTLTELASERLILPEDGSFTQRVFMAKAAEIGCQFNRIVKTTTFPVVKEAVLHGVGVGLLLVDSLFASSNIVTIEIDEMPERYRNFLVTPEEKKDLRIVRSLLEVAL